jgi:hypothetical protein
MVRTCHSALSWRDARTLHQDEQGSRLDRRGEQRTLGPLRRQTVRRTMVLAVVWTATPDGGASGSKTAPNQLRLLWCWGGGLFTQANDSISSLGSR